MITLPVLLFIATWTFYRLAWRYNRNGFSYALLGFSLFTLIFLASIAFLSAIIHTVNPGIYGSFLKAFKTLLKGYFINSKMLFTEQLFILTPCIVICSIVYFINYLGYRRKALSGTESKNLLDRLPK